MTPETDLARLRRMFKWISSFTALGHPLRNLDAAPGRGYATRMSYSADLGPRTFTKPDGSSWTGRAFATDEHERPPWVPPGPNEEGIELLPDDDGQTGFFKLTDTPKGIDAYRAGVTHSDAAMRVGLTADWTAGTLTVTFDPGTPQAAVIGICHAPGA